MAGQVKPNNYSTPLDLRVIPFGPCRHAEAVEAVFLIPAGKVREFEIEAGVGFARLFRPS